MAVDIPGYTIERTLGRGGMATVYLAIQEVFEREVALKVMSKVLAEDPNFGQRFFREAKIVSKLVHPNIVTVHDVGMHDGHCYLSMEYIDGRDLKHCVSGMTLREKITAIRDIAKALIYAGEKGYVHRDIKPENIMFHSSDGRAVLMDFGIARAAESNTQVTQAGTAIGTPHYMSPEQAKGKPVDGRSDIYSLGVVFFYILAGRVPFDAESAVAIGIKHITEPVPLLPDIYEGLQPFIDKMMAKDVSERYQNARELLNDIDELDIELLEHSAEFASDLRATSGHTPLEALTRLDSAEMESFETDAQSLADLGTFNSYDVERDTRPKDSASILPGFLAGAFVVSVVAAFVYFRHPEFVRPWLDTFTAYFDNDHREDSLQDQDKSSELSADIVDEVRETTVPSASVRPPVRSLQPAANPVAEISATRANTVDLRQKIESLRAAYATDSIYLSDLVAAYRALFVVDPTDTQLRQEFEALRQEQMDDVMAFAARNGSSPRLDKRLSQFRVLFPETDESVIDKVLTSARQRKRAMNLVLEGDAYLSQNNLTKPAGRNALDAYNSALALDPENTEAQQGRMKIADKLAKLAVQRYERNELGAALTSAQAALAIDQKNADARRIDTQVKEILQKTQRIDSLLKQADKKIKRGDLYTPENAGAFHDFRMVLLIQSDNEEAKQGVERVVDALSTRVWQLVGDKKFAEAKALMRAPQREDGTNARIKSLAAALDEVAGDNNLGSDPSIDGLVIAGTPIANVGAKPSDIVRADRSIFLGFRYANFRSPTSVIQAVLLDGSRSVTIAQVPVIVEGASGRSTFRIDRPVDGFPSGSYTIEMRLGQQTLNSTVFRVE